MKILITGGTSGLGLAIARSLIEKGCSVVITGRKNRFIEEVEGKIDFVAVDFCNLGKTAGVFKSICKDHQFDIVVNNAGVLSPPRLILTNDGYEYTFQVNFLAHLLLNEIIIRNTAPDHHLKIASVISLAYRIAHFEPDGFNSGSGYRPFRAYSNSKLYLTLMCSWLSEKYHTYNLKSFGFDPGIFSSEIYRMQKKWFRSMYMLGAPFMRDPLKTAISFCNLVERDDLVNGAVYQHGKYNGTIPEVNQGNISLFWKNCYEMIDPFLEETVIGSQK